MSARHREPIGLDENQRTLVRENVGLVGTHLRRNVPRLRDPRGRGEWEELFQEGCMGLIRAATEFDAKRGIPFAAFAFPRIHKAVSGALADRSLVRTPQGRKRATDGDDRHNPFIKTVSLSDKQADLLSSRKRAVGEVAEREDASGDTIGARLRRKYERAIRSAAESATRAGRGDRSLLVDLILKERLLVPDEHSRRSLRSIAEQTTSSFGRVMDCEKKILSGAREALEADAEFEHLRRLAAGQASGAESPVDACVERELAAAAADDFVARFRNADRNDRGRMIAELLDFPADEAASWIRQRFSLLTEESREEVVRRTFRADPTVPVKDKAPVC